MEPEDPRLKGVIEAMETSGARPEAPDFYAVVRERSAKTETMVEKENREILDMRKTWSGWVLFLIVIIVAFDIVLVSLYGTGVWKFEDPNVVLFVITENFLKIIGLGFLITREIFKKIYIDKRHRAVRE